MVIKQWFPKHGSQWVKNWVAPRRSEPGLYIFTVTTACGLERRYLRKEQIADSEKELSNLLLKTFNTMIIFLSYVV